MKTRCHGFTLIELMIAVAIIGILVMVAYPSYQNHLQKSRRSDAMIALGQLATLQEQYFFRENKYTDQISDLGSSAASTSPEGYYSLAMATANSGATYTLTATATGGQTKDTECRLFTVDNFGRKTSTTSSSGDSTADCW